MSVIDDISPQERLLRRLLRGEEPTVELLLELLRARVEEDVHLDYKAGDIVLKRDSHRAEPGHPVEFKGKLRKHVAGFANGHGGVVVIGVAEPPERLDQTTGRCVRDRSAARTLAPIPLGRDEVLARYRDSLDQLRMFLQPPPRAYVVEHDGGTILFVAVARAESAVLCLENSVRVYYVRLHDSTQGAPEYLVDDILLGRRRRPSFTVSLPGPRVEQVPGENHLVLAPVLANTGPVWMDEARIGVVGHFVSGGQPVGEALAPYLDVRPWNPRRPQASLVWFRTGTPVASIAPFEIVDHAAESLPIGVVPGSLWWRAALLVVCRNQPPSWHQLVVWWDKHAPARAWVLALGDLRATVAAHYGGQFERWEPPIDWFRVVRRGGEDYDVVLTGGRTQG